VTTSFTPSCERVAVLARRTDSNSPADWLFIASRDLEGVRELASRELAFAMCVSKLAEILEKIIKAELIRTGWFLVKTHDLVRLVDDLRERDPGLADRFQPLCEELAERYFTDRYPGFDLEDEDWPRLRRQADQIADLLATVNKRVETSS
jgi:HEPN domain-containing protein